MSTETTTLPIVGLTMKAVTMNDSHDQIDFESTCGRRFRMDHSQDCCEHVRIEDLCGELEWLVGSPIVSAYESSRDGSADDNLSESGTWTFYRIATEKGLVVIRWLGESNGYYSESVDFVEITQ
jgi:hypothetical protein